MAFHGETDGLTGVNDVALIVKNRTTTDRTCSGSFADHITSSNLVVPSGYRGLIIAHFFSNGLFESEAGAYATRIRLTGSASSTPNETTGHQGYHDNYAGSAADFQAFDVGPGTYQVKIQVRERRGNVIFNNRGQTDSLTSTLFTYRA